MNARKHPVTPFDNVESAHEYVSLLVEAVEEAVREVEEEIVMASNNDATRRVDALRLAGFKLDKLKGQLVTSARLLNDLRTLRRLLLEERSTSEGS